MTNEEFQQAQQAAAPTLTFGEAFTNVAGDQVVTGTNQAQQAAEEYISRKYGEGFSCKSAEGKTILDGDGPAFYVEFEDKDGVVFAVTENEAMTRCYDNYATKLYDEEYMKRYGHTIETFWQASIKIETNIGPGSESDDKDSTENIDLDKRAAEYSYIVYIRLDETKDRYQYADEICDTVKYVKAIDLPPTFVTVTFHKNNVYKGGYRFETTGDYPDAASVEKAMRDYDDSIS